MEVFCLPVAALSSTPDVITHCLEFYMSSTDMNESPALQQMKSCFLATLAAWISG